MRRERGSGFLTLFRQLSVTVTLLFGVLLVGSLLVSVLNARAYFLHQLHSHAQDTATSLALSISPAFNRNDQLALQTMTDVIFDRGYFRSIVLSNLAGDVIVQRQSRPKAAVPQWFMQAVSLNVEPATAEIVNGWQRSGLVSVTSHPGQVYQDLWRTTLQALLWFGAMGGVTILVLLVLVRHALRPLDALERQANAIFQQDFSVQAAPPRTRELRRVVIAMNRMTLQLKAVFDEQLHAIEKVREQAHQDPVTGLGNQFYFDARFQAMTEDPHESLVGAVLILSFRDFNHYNTTYGRVAGDLLLKQVAGRWQKVLEQTQGAVIAKQAGANLAAWLPNVSLERAEQLLQSVFSGIMNLPLFTQQQKLDFLHIGLAHCDVGRDGQTLLQAADEALRAARAKGVNGFHVTRLTGRLMADVDFTQADCQRLLLEALSNEQLCWFYQPVIRSADESIFFYEVLLRLRWNDTLVAAHVFLPLVERFGLQVKYDQYSIQKVIRLLADEAMNESFCVNVSPLSIQAEGFIEWLLNEIRDTCASPERLVIEIPEYALSFVSAKVQTLATGLAAMGAKLSIDHFGVGTKSFSYLSALPLHAIKVDYSYIRDLAENKDHQFFIQSLLQIVHSRDILMLAENVETQQQWDLLKSFQVDGGQGYLLGEPAENCGVTG